MGRAAKPLVEILSDLVAFKTVTGDHLSAADCREYLESFLSRCGMQLQNHKSGEFTSLVATTQATKRPKILLQAHLDVVPAGGPLFKLHEKGGSLVGRGVYDMKFAGAVFLKLVDDLQAKLNDY